MRKTSGFSIVELLVVLAIILLLLSLFLPVLIGSIARARTVSCASNLRQIGLAIQMYSQDHDSTYPMGAYSSIGDTSGRWDRSWHDVIGGYMKNDLRVVVCPELKGDNFRRRSYGANPWLLTFRVGTKESVVSEGSLVLIAEHETGDWPCYPHSYWDSPTHPYLTARHQQRLNVLFTDGSVHPHSPEENSAIRMWQPK